MIANGYPALPAGTVVRATNGRIRWPETVLKTAATVAGCSGGKWYTSIPEIYACLALQLQEQDRPGEGHVLWLVHPSTFRAPPALCQQCHTELFPHRACPGQPGGEPCGRPVCAIGGNQCCLCQRAGQAEIRQEEGGQA